MIITTATDQRQWDDFLTSQSYKPFLQSWTMGEVYKAIGQEPVRLIVKDGENVQGICFGHIVPARRGRHLSIPYGPVLEWKEESGKRKEMVTELVRELSRVAKEHGCSFIRMSPFWEKSETVDRSFEQIGAKSSPLHLLAEHLWYLPLKTSDTWTGDSAGVQLNPEDLFKTLRATHRNLIRRAQKEGVTIRASTDPNTDIEHFLKLHDETRKRHGFTAYTDSFFRAQVELFTPRGEATLYLAHYQDQVIAASVHMHIGGETSYHHGASTPAFSKIPASYLLQWTAIEDAIKRGDHVYNFWGIAPTTDVSGTLRPEKGHPFAGVTLFKTGFPGKLLELTHCRDIPLSASYHLTRGFELLRKWKRGF
jgi:lipid II:glycine glycyltransferase (peptidoglycan interpeptide bridge formation enzyme)